MEQAIHLYRKRYIPNESVYLKDDQILAAENNLIITRWNTLKPRRDISHGYSAYFIDKGFKVSKMYNADNQLVYWYCDIISTQYTPETNTYVFQDLLADVLVYPDGSVKVVDLDEIADLLDKGVIDASVASHALRILNQLLQIIYQGEFETFQNVINHAENES